MQQAVCAKYPMTAWRIILSVLLHKRVGSIPARLEYGKDSSGSSNLQAFFNKLPIIHRSCTSCMHDYIGTIVYVNILTKAWKAR